MISRIEISLEPVVQTRRQYTTLDRLDLIVVSIELYRLSSVLMRLITRSEHIPCSLSRGAMNLRAPRVSDSKTERLAHA